jgi:hypothetical protein
MMGIQDVAGKKVPVKGGGLCIYCGWDGGEDGLHDEHIIPYSLGGNTELLNASCPDCEAITSYLDGYMARAIFGHMRAHINLQSRSGHKRALPAVIELADGERAIDFATPEHPYFLNMPIWKPPGITIGERLSDDFGPGGKFTYYYAPPSLKDTLGLKDGDVARVIDKSPPHNFGTFARGLAKIAYCDAIFRFGLDGFRPLALPDIILGRYPNIAHFVGSQTRQPLPRHPRGRQHSINLDSRSFGRFKFLLSVIRLFGDSGTPDRGMPFYAVICGIEGKRKIIPRQRLPRRGEKILL